MQNIEKIVDELLKEPINHVFGDSGSAYGYRYAKNQEQGYLKGLQEVEEDTNGDERTLDVVIPLYDFLTYNLIKDEVAVGIEKQLFKELELHGINPYHIFDVADFLNSGEFTALNIENEVKYVNTYNYEEYLSQTIQYAVLYTGLEHYVILQVHNGCDVRSGYTRPQIFQVKDIDYFISGQFDRFCECECGLNDYNFYYNEVTDSNCNIVDAEDVYNNTFIDADGHVRCAECKSIIKGGFRKW